VATQFNEGTASIPGGYSKIILKYLEVVIDYHYRFLRNTLNEIV